MSFRLVLGVLFLHCFAQGQEVHLKSPVLRRVLDAKEIAGHRIVEFDHTPNREDLARLAAGGAQITGALPDNAVMVNGLTDVPEGVRWVGMMDTAARLSPELDQQAASQVVLIEFHADTDQAAQDRAAEAAGTVLMRPRILLAAHAVAVVDAEQLQALAARDEVAYVFPADRDFTDPALATCAGMLTTNGRVGQYANLVHGWDKGPDGYAHLSYQFASLPAKAPANLVQSEILRALNEWSRYAKVAIEAPGTSPERTITIRFASGAHGDAYSFDGRGGTLAHTFYPLPVNPEPIAGDMHLDADESWNVGGDPDIYTVALHEAGHAFGLGHSDRPGDVMYPYYRRNLTLSANDIGALRQLYGARDAAPAQVTPSAPPALTLTLDSAPTSTSAAVVVLSGTVSGGAAPLRLQWQSDRGASGVAGLTGASFRIAAIPLFAGSNAVTITLFDAAGRSVSRTAVITRAAGPSGAAVASIRILSPAGATVSVSSASLNLSGTASASGGIARVTWQTAAGASGEAQGGISWVAPNIPLMMGSNTLIVRVWDQSGLSAWSTVQVTRR